MRRSKRTARFAFVTFLVLNDSYLPGALVLGHALRLQDIKADLVCLVTDDITSPALRSLSLIYDRVIHVDRIFVPSKRSHKHPGIPLMFTRLNALRLGPDGDLGCSYEKVVVLDSDVLPLERYEDLFSVGTPAGIINERKEFLRDFDHESDSAKKEDRTRGQWGWHKRYEDICAHGEPIPRYITDRVQRDPTNMGVNGSLFILSPSIIEFHKVMRDLSRPDVIRFIAEELTWPDMQYLTMKWSGEWKNVDLRFSSINGYPSLALLYGTHFAGVKPWNFRNKSIRHYSRFDDFTLWHKMYLEMMLAYPALAVNKRLSRLSASIDELARQHI